MLEMAALWRFFGLHSIGIRFGRRISKAMSGKSIYIQVFVQSFRAGFGKKNTRLRDSVLVECRVAITLYRLGSGNTLIMIADLFGLGESTTSIIVRECCEAIRILLKPLVFKRPTLIWMKKIAAEFEALHGIPLIIGAIDDSYILIIAPSNDPVSYYCRKGFYSYLLQGVVDSKYKFWDYDFGWCGRIHDWTLFQKTEIGKKNHERCISFFQVHW